MKYLKRSWIIAAVLLLIENLIIFKDYWFKGFGPARDFAVTYHAMPFHWIQRAIEFDFAQWVPTVAMGYPIQMDPQSAMFYPAIWFFVLFKIPYSLTAAIVLQLLHVYLGSIGAYVLMRTLKFEFKIALFAALCFQLIGGFQHVSHDPDIIRGYALYPWLLFSLIYIGRKSLPIFFIPFMFYLFITGVYPGNVTALLFVSVFFIIVYVCLNQELDTKSKISFLLTRGGLAVLGIIMASVWLLPILLNKSELSRMNIDMVVMKRHFFKIENFFSTVFNADTPGLEQSQDITMRSLFVGGGVLLPIGFIAWTSMRRILPWIVLILFSWFLGCGNYFYHYLGIAFPPLLFSRFLTSDYLPGIVLPLIVLSCFGLESLFNTTVSRLRTIVVFALAIGFVLYGKSVMQVSLDQSAASILGLLSLIVLAAILVLLFFKPNLSVKKVSSILCLLILVNGIDFYRAVETNSQAWKVPDFDNWYQQKTKFDTNVFSPGLLSWISKGAISRPRRFFNTDDEFFWRGWLTGEFSMTDYGITLQRAMTILMDKENDIREFMMRPSEGHLVASEKDMTFPDLMKQDSNLCGQVRYLKYTLSEVQLSFSLSHPCVFFHNELFFPGWVGKLTNKNGQYDEVVAFGVANGLLRAYELPAGEFTLKETFTIPGFKLGGILSLAALFLWCMLLLCTFLSVTKRFKICNRS
jgi:hypothetical protein